MPTLSSDPLRRVGLLSLIALVLAVVAVTLAAWALLQSHSSERSYRLDPATPTNLADPIVGSRTT
jgi:hypothetical protein